MKKEDKLSYCKYCKLPKHLCQCTSGEWSADYKSVAGTLYNCGVEHDYRFSHYEEDQNMSTTATLNGKYAIMICRHCGSYIKQQIF